MRETVISVTEASRNFADCVNRAHYRNETFLLLKNGVPFARIVPDRKRGPNGKELAELIGRIKLTPEEGEAWARDLAEAKESLIPQPDKWE